MATIPALIGREATRYMVAQQFLTRLPTPGWIDYEPGGLARAARYFPLVGVAVGGLSALTWMIFAPVLPGLLTAGLALAVLILATGALHEDGFADCCDGLGGGASRDRALEIMRDSRIGSYGTCALIASVGLRALAIGGMSAYEGFIALIIAHGLSRGLIPLVLVSGKYARTRGLASSVADGVSTPEVLVSVAISAVLVFLAGPAVGIATLAAVLVMGGLMLAILVRRLGGYTGDGLGAIQQVAEISALITLAAFLA